MVWWVLLGACGLDEGRWAEAAARAECDQAQRCDAAAFASAWTGPEECRSRRAPAWQGQVGCVFDEVAAEVCLDGLRSICGPPPPCAAVWRCGGTPVETAATGETADTGT